MEDKKLVTEGTLEKSPSFSRRDFVSAALGASLMSMVPPGVRSGAWAAGSDAPEKKEVRIGFIPLTDCASVVMASVMKFDEKYGIKIIPTKEASWASVRDKLVNGELDAPHVLYGLIYGVQLGVGGPKKDMSVLMSLNNNGQAITLANKLKDQGRHRWPQPGQADRQEGGEYTFAQTFPTGTHAMWLYYWLAAQGINPMKDVKTITVPPPQMVANMRVGNMDGFCVGEPWNNRAIIDNIGFTATTTQDIWTDHPEKVLGTTADWVKQNPNTARAMTRPFSKPQVDRRLARQQAEDGRNDCQKAYVNTDTGRHRRTHARSLPERPGQELGRQELHEVLQRRCGELPLSQRRHVVPDPAQALGLAQEPSGLPGRRQAGQPHRHLQAGATAAGVACRRATCAAQDDRRRGLGWQGSGQVRRRFQGQGIT
jgi:nitrate/nitrite transport system substrate-binding protein